MSYHPQTPPLLACIDGDHDGTDVLVVGWSVDDALLDRDHHRRPWVGGAPAIRPVVVDLGDSSEPRIATENLVYRTPAATAHGTIRVRNT